MPPKNIAKKPAATPNNNPKTDSRQQLLTLSKQPIP